MRRPLFEERITYGGDIYRVMRLSDETVSDIMIKIIELGNTYLI